MAGSCEISNIFSNYISAMYQPDEVQPTLNMLGHPGDDSTLGLSLPTSQPPAQSTGRTEGPVVSAQGSQHTRQQQGLEEHCKVLVPLGQVNSSHHASVSPGVCWLKDCCGRPWVAQRVAALERIRGTWGMRESLPSSPSMSQGMGCQGSPRDQFGSTVRVTGGPPLHQWDRHGVALGEARGTHQQSRVDPSIDGTNGTETNHVGSVMSLVSPRTGAGQSEVTQGQALSACQSHNPPSAGPAVPRVSATGPDLVPNCSWQPTRGTRCWHSRPGPEPRSPCLADKPEWFSELPYFWTKVQVLEWISYHVEKNKYDASSIDFSCCNMDGHALCHCTRDQMRLIFGPLGDELYDRLHEISECPNVPFVPRPGNSKNKAERPPTSPGRSASRALQGAAWGRFHWGGCIGGRGGTDQSPGRAGLSSCYAPFPSIPNRHR